MKLIWERMKIVSINRKEAMNQTQQRTNIQVFSVL